MFSRWLRAFGVDWKTFYTSLKGLRRFSTNYLQISELNFAAGNLWKIRPNYPCLHEFYDQSGVARGHYFHQDLYVAQKIFRKAPARHVDVGSRIDGFVAHVATFRELEVLDFRDLTSRIPGILFRRCDLLDIPAQFHDYCDSLSCLHVLEHVGLGRYGDPIDLHGATKALDNLAKILKPGGTLYLSTPFGSERIDYNAHRVFHLRTIRDLVQKSLDIVEFSMVDDAGELQINADLDSVEGVSDRYQFALAIFELRKPHRVW